MDGLSATYTDGVLLMGVEDDKLPSAADLSQTSFTVEIAPPEGVDAVYYRENRSGGNNIFDYDPVTEEDQKGIMQHKPLRTIATDPMTLNTRPCNKYTSQLSDDLTLSIYLFREATPEYFSEDDQEFMVYRTEYGLCIEVNSLSPFVLSWEDALAAEMILPTGTLSIRDQAFLNGVFTVVRIPDGCTITVETAE